MDAEYAHAVIAFLRALPRRSAEGGGAGRTENPWAVFGLRASRAPERGSGPGGPTREPRQYFRQH